MHRYLLSSCPGVVHLLLYVGSVLHVLVEVADVAGNVMVRLEAERYDGYLRPGLELICVARATL